MRTIHRFRKFYLILIIIIIILLVLYWYIPNINSAKSSIIEFDYKYYDVICKNQFPEYENIINK